jgi:basic membrane lipoprotein Med (substrate-binding protein (PBP1-ABC) superfamily)
MRSFVAGHRWWLAGVAVFMLIVGLSVWIFWPGGGPKKEPARARQYLEVTACLLTDEHGIAADPAKTMWGGMQSASLATRAKVEYLAVVGQQTPDNAVPFANSLAQGRCAVVFAAGPVQEKAVRQVSSSFPEVRFYVSQGDGAGNIGVLDGSSAQSLSAGVDQAVRTVVQESDRH